MDAIFSPLGVRVGSLLSRRGHQARLSRCRFRMPDILYKLNTICGHTPCNEREWEPYAKVDRRDS